MKIFILISLLTLTYVTSTSSARGKDILNGKKINPDVMNTKVTPVPYHYDIISSSPFQTKKEKKSSIPSNIESKLTTHVTIDKINMIGVVYNGKNNNNIAVVRHSDGSVYSVKVGDYIGQYNLKVKLITNKFIDVYVDNTINHSETKRIYLDSKTKRINLNSKTKRINLNSKTKRINLNSKTKRINPDNKN